MPDPNSALSAARTDGMGVGSKAEAGAKARQGSRLKGEGAQAPPCHRDRLLSLRGQL